MTRRHRLAVATAVLFLAAIAAANYLTTTYGLVPVAPGLTATAGTYLAGLTFVLRDAVQDTAGRRATIALIALGAGLSYLVADPFIALASGLAFLGSELADQAIYSPLRARGYVRAAIASNTVGAVLDSLLFLAVAGFAITGPVLAGQVVGKLTVTAAVVLLVAARRRA